MGLLYAADGATSFSVPCFTVLTAASCGAAAGFCFADLLRVVTGLLTADLSSAAVAIEAKTRTMAIAIREGLHSSSGFPQGCAQGGAAQFPEVRGASGLCQFSNLSLVRLRI